MPCQSYPHIKRLVGGRSYTIGNSAVIGVLVEAICCKGVGDARKLWLGQAILLGVVEALDVRVSQFSSSMIAFIWKEYVQDPSK